MPTVQVYKPQVQIFQFKMFDIGTDEFKQSRRWATRDFIERVGGLMTGRAAKVLSDDVDAQSDRSPDLHGHGLRSNRALERLSSSLIKDTEQFIKDVQERKAAGARTAKALGRAL